MLTQFYIEIHTYVYIICIKRKKNDFVVSSYKLYVHIALDFMCNVTQPTFEESL